MASLTGTKIKNTYDSLLKTTDNEPLDGTLRTITDGLGNNSSLSLSTDAASVGGDLDVTGTIYAASNITHLGDTDTYINFDTNQITVYTGGFARFNVSDSQTSVYNALFTTSTLYVAGDYASIDGNISLANGKIAVGGSIASFFSSDANLLVIGDTGAGVNQGMTIVSPTGRTGNIYFADGTTGNERYRGSVTYDHNVDTLYLGAAATNKLALSDTQSIFSGNVLVVGNLPSYTNSLYVDSTTNNVGIGTNNPHNSSGYAGLHLNGATGGVVKFMDDETVVSQIFGNNNEITIQAEGERDVVVKTNNSERLRIEDAGASVTGTLRVSGNATFDSNIFVDGNVINKSDLDTSVAFGTNQISLITGGLTRLSASDASVQVTNPLVASSTLAVTGDASFNIDTLYVDVSSDRVGVNTNVPTEALDVVGNIKASGTLAVTTGTINGIDAIAISAQNVNTNGTTFALNSRGTVGIMTFLTASTERMRIDSAGNVGIGTTNGDIFGRFYTRSVGIDSSGVTKIQIDGASYSGIDFGVNGTRNGEINNSGSFDFSTLDARAITFNTNGSERMRIDSAGNVTIRDGKKLILNRPDNAIDCEISSNASGTLILNSRNGEGFDFQNGGTGAMRIDSSGYIGIGTSSPRLRIEVTGTDAAESGTATPNGAIMVGNPTASNSQVLTMGTMNGVGNHSWIQSRNSTQALFYNLALNPNGGNVGIGTQSPSNFGAGNTTIDVVGSAGGALVARGASVTGELYASDAGGGVFVSSKTNHPIMFRTNDAERLRIDSSGNVGIGVSPSGAKLHTYTTGAQDNLLKIQNGQAGYASGIQLQGSTDGGSVYNFITSGTAGSTPMWQIGGGATNNTMALHTGGSEKMRIDASGNLIVNSSSGSIVNSSRSAVSVSTSATVISKPATYGGLAMVWVNSGGNLAHDLVSYSLSDVDVLASQNISGSPVGRTYTAVNGELKVAMASGTYDVFCSEIRVSLS